MSESNNLRIVGVALAVAGAVLFFAKAGFPPEFTTTYHYTATGVTHTTSPGVVVVTISLLLIAVGGVLARLGGSDRQTAARLASAGPSKAAATKPCTQCGKAVPIAARLCRHCGGPLTRQAS